MQVRKYQETTERLKQTVKELAARVRTWFKCQRSKQERESRL